ncbi:MAG: hypothetical protein J6M95_01700 [Bacilli bacterium]|nr:hypothetical protein [Bacilli bacterium]
MENIYKPIPFWSWNDELEPEELEKQIEWMHENGIGGFFMHARGGLTTPYLGKKWFECVEACLKKAKELNMEAYAYDENGWPSGFAGGKLLEDEYNRDMYLSYKYGKYDPSSKVAYDYHGKSLKIVNSGEDVLNIYLHTSTSTADILNEKVVRKFIDLTHEQYKKHDICGNLRGFFTDEPQYYRWGTSFTRVLPEYFLSHYGEDVFERIGLLFVDKEGYQDYRYKYYKSLQDLMLNSWAKQLYDWCEDNGYKLTGHYIEEMGLGKQILCNGGIMPFYEYEQIPGVDHLGRPSFDNISGRQIGSAMAQLNKRQGLCEMFACAGWDATPLELKRIAEYYMVNGVNVICHHLLPYSEHGQRKRDYPEHYSKINPWVEKGFKDFNDHFSHISELLVNSKEVVSVGVFHPIRSAYFSYKRELEWGLDFGCKELDDNFRNISNTLTYNGVQFHYLDEVIMKHHAHVEGDALVIGDYHYKYIVIPKGTLTMDVETKNLFEEYARNGGKFYIEGDVPTYLEGKPYSHGYMKNNSSLEEIINSKPFKSEYSESVKITYRILDNGTPSIYIFNLGKETNIKIEVPGYSSFNSEKEVISNNIHLNDSESKILYFSNEIPKKTQETSLITLSDSFKVIGKPLNYLTIDYLSYSKDGKSYSNKIHYMGIFNLLLKERYEGELYLKYEFETKDIPSECELLLEDTHTLEVKVNGQVVNKKGTVLEKDLWSYDIAKNIIEGHNEIIIKINFFESEQVYYALFGENVQESIKNCLVYDTTIEAIYLRGNFGVFGDFRDGETKDVVVGNNFYLGKQKDEVSCLIKDGYPFFRGTICLSQDIDVKDTNKTLLIDKRFQMIDLYVNDVFVKRMMFDYKVDLSKYLEIGKNNIKLELVVSNRNLLGPHHDQLEEPLNVGPYSFERFGSWDEKGQSELCLQRYSFVKTII